MRMELGCQSPKELEEKVRSRLRPYLRCKLIELVLVLRIFTFAHTEFRKLAVHTIRVCERSEPFLEGLSNVVRVCRDVFTLEVPESHRVLT